MPFSLVVSAAHLFSLDAKGKCPWGALEKTALVRENSLPEASYKRPVCPLVMPPPDLTMPLAVAAGVLIMDGFESDGWAGGCSLMTK